MRSRELVTALREHIAKELENYPFPDPSGVDHSCRVFLHGLSDAQDAKTYPFVCVRWMDGELEEADAQASVKETVGLVLGVYTPESQEAAGILLAELVDALMGIVRRTRLLAQKFQLQLPIHASMPDPERKWNEYHMATLTTTWQYAIPVTPLFEGGRSFTELDWRRK